MLQVVSVPPIPLFHADDVTAEFSKTRHHPDVQDDLDSDMDVDDEYGTGLGVGSSSRAGKNITSPGEVVTSAKEFMRGHGTYTEGDNVLSTVAGTIERVNKLVSVRSVRQRYNPEKGDLVIGRVIEVVQQRWKVDTNARQDAILALSSVNLPGGVQRRKVETDALKMREFLAEGDLLVAEVQSVENAPQLHTRSLRYGKLRNGLLLTVPPSLIRRLKSHFHTLPPPCGPLGVDVIMGVNGYIWVSVSVGERNNAAVEGFVDAEGVYSDVNDDISQSSRLAISQVANLIMLFARYSIPLSDTLLSDAYAWCRDNGLTKSGQMMDKEMEKRCLTEITGMDVREEL